MNFFQLVRGIVSLEQPSQDGGVPGLIAYYDNKLSFCTRTSMLFIETDLIKQSDKPMSISIEDIGDLRSAVDISEDGVILDPDGDAVASLSSETPPSEKFMKIMDDILNREDIELPSSLVKGFFPKKKNSAFRIARSPEGRLVWLRNKSAKPVILKENAELTQHAFLNDTTGGVAYPRIDVRPFLPEELEVTLTEHHLTTKIKFNFDTFGEGFLYLQTKAETLSEEQVQKIVEADKTIAKKNSKTKKEGDKKMTTQQAPQVPPQQAPQVPPPMTTPAPPQPAPQVPPQQAPQVPPQQAPQVPPQPATVVEEVVEPVVEEVVESAAEDVPPWNTESAQEEAVDTTATEVVEKEAPEQETEEEPSIKEIIQLLKQSVTALSKAYNAEQKANKQIAKQAKELEGLEELKQQNKELLAERKKFQDVIGRLKAFDL
jgi:hypothetical protein